MKRILTALIALILIPLGMAEARAQEGAPGATLEPTDGGAPLSITSQEVDVHIANGIAVTTVNQVFHNSTDRQLEAVYSFPVPADASLASYSMWINGKEVIGEVLERKEARRIYESITRTRRDPGLVEQVSHKLFQARIFPVPPRGDQRVRLSYYQPVTYDGGFCTYVYPLRIRSAEFESVTDTYTIRVDVDSDIPVAEVRSPSHGDRVVFQREANGRVIASYERPRDRINRDFVLIYRLEKEKTGAHLTGYADGEEERYFMLTLTPGELLEREEKPLHYVVLLDVSGSMEGDKIETARKAIAAVMKQMDPEDTFRIVTFNVGTQVWPVQPMKAGDVSPSEGERFLERIRAAGGTDLMRGLQTAVESMEKERENVLVLFSDGISDSSDRAVREIRSLFPERSVRIFALGIGNEINRGVLGRLARETGGWTDFMSASGELDHRVKLLAQKIVHESVTDAVVSVEGIETWDLHPGGPMHLFRGSQVTLFGRYRGSGEAKVIVRGNLKGAPRSFEIPVVFPEKAIAYPEIRRAWALKAVEGELEKGGPASVRKVTDLGIEYSIVTPYTSMLVLESEAQYGQFGIERRNPGRVLRERRAQKDRRDNPSPSGNGGSGGGAGGSVELVMLGLGAAAAAAGWRRRRRKEA